uniref:Uncharacterized protein n=1 Tax=Sphaeramia orbicularis TaxID=375764 RepID=A0A672ZPB5_9TELE
MSYLCLCSISHDPYQYPFTLTNLGQRTHRLYWGTDGFSPSDKAHVRKSPLSRTSLPPISVPMKKTAVVSGPWASPPRRKPVFSISPPRVELYPGCSVDMMLSGFSDSSEVVRERLECRGIVGNQGCCEHIMSVDVTCRFVAPMISIEPKQLNFYIDKIPGTSPTPLYEKLVLKNISTLTVSMEMYVMVPFSVCDTPGVYSSSTSKSMVLGGGKQAELWICFNPAFCQDRVSRVVHEFLEVRYHGHPHQDMVELHAEVHFPNLHFSTDSVDFGCVLNCTETQREITVTNCSPLPVSYRWTFLMEQKHRYMFDVLPIYGRLQPGEQQPITFSFYGHSYVSREVVAQCHVEEGPTYEVKLRGEASELTYGLDLTHVDFDSASLRTLLPEQLLVHVLAERLQSRDCRSGAVVEGLESLYTSSPSKTLQVILKAFDDRKHVYVVDVSDSYDAMKARQTAKREEEGKYDHRVQHKQTPAQMTSGVSTFSACLVLGIVEFLPV